jgi:beta-N-acetylhexosaminidase
MRTPARRIAVLAGLLLVLGACSPGGTGDAAQSPSTSRTSAGSSTTSAPTPGPEDAVEAALAGLDRRAQVAQLFVAGVRLEELGVGEGLARSGVGGIFLAGRSDAAAADLAATVTGWQSVAPGPGLWVAVDQEGGAVQTLRGPGFEPLPSALDQGSLPPGDLAALADRLGAALHGAGLNLDLAPVVDIVAAGTANANPPIGAFDRQYGGTAAVVVAAAGTVVDGLAAHGVTATLKHFPGLGRVQSNTDTAADVVDSTTTADDEQVAAFGELARSPAHPFVMASSARYTQLDPDAVAAFSPIVLTDLLRERLGFDGVIISDDLGDAAAVQDVPPGERAVRFLAAGGTLVLTVDPAIVPAMIDAVLARSDTDPAFAATVDAAVHTALLAKERAGLLPG